MNYELSMVVVDTNSEELFMWSNHHEMYIYK